MFDQYERHSKFICHTCISKIRRAKKNGVGVIQSARQDSENASHIWSGFSVCDVSQCSSCSHRQILSKVNTRRLHAVRVNVSVCNDEECEENSVIESSFSQQPQCIDFDESSVNTACKPKADSSSTTPQKSSVMKDSSTEMTPQKSSTPINTSTSISRPVMIECGQSPLEKSKDLLNISKCLDDSFESPITNKEERLYELTTRKKKPIFLMPLTKPQISSKDCSRITKYKRTMELDNVRQFIAGPSTDDANAQLENEIKTLGKKRKIECEKEKKIIIDEKQSLMITERLDLSWRKKNKLREMMKSMNVHFRGEAKMRRLANEIVCEFVSSKLCHFVFTEKRGKERVEYRKEAPLAYIADLEKLLTHLLDAYSAEGRLTWRGGAIPDDEVWIKVGGDHGKSSLKLTLQICNLDQPNAQRNVFCFC